MEKLVNALKSGSKFTLNLLRTTVVASCLLLAVLMAPQGHSWYLRNYKGDKVTVMKGKYGGGTGFHVKGLKTGKTYIMTNAHVCLLANKNDDIYVKAGNGVVLKRKVLFRAKNHDLCLVEAMPGYEGLSVGHQPWLGEIVGLIGHPKLRPLTLSRGEIIGKRIIKLLFGYNLPNNKCIGQNINTDHLNIKHIKSIIVPNRLAFKASFKVNNIKQLRNLYKMMGINYLCIAELDTNMMNGISYKGNSGSPVVSFFGNVVGVLFAGSQDVTDAYLVPLYKVREVLKQF